MKYFNNIKVSVFAKQDKENCEAIKHKLIELMPFDLEKEKLFVKEQKTIGFNEKIIYVYEIYLTKDKHINAFVKFLINKLTDEQKELIKRQLESRLDEEYNFFLRFDKEKLLNDKFWITDSGNCYHIRANVACFPRRREKALAILREIFK